jgi:predicted short-subunit dehydrogenase-like oxidoreductase (DUF2520 family)
VELDRTVNESIAIIGDGRLGGALARALRLAGASVTGPHGRGFSGDGSPVAIACVPDSAIGEAAGLVPDGVLVGHCSGACPLAELGERPAFGMHPLMTFPGGEVHLDGVWCAVSGTGPAEEREATRIAGLVGMRPFSLDEEDRAAYHAAASMASNFLIALEADAQALATAAGVPPEALVPLVKATVSNWARSGAEGALTGPIARGDEATVERQREAIKRTAPHLLPAFDALAERTRELAARATGALA